MLKGQGFAGAKPWFEFGGTGEICEFQRSGGWRPFQAQPLWMNFSAPFYRVPGSKNIKNIGKSGFLRQNCIFFASSPAKERGGWRRRFSGARFCLFIDDPIVAQVNFGNAQAGAVVRRGAFCFQRVAPQK